MRTHNSIMDNCVSARIRFDQSDDSHAESRMDGVRTNLFLDSGTVSAIAFEDTGLAIPQPHSVTIGLPPEMRHALFRNAGDKKRLMGIAEGIGLCILSALTNKPLESEAPPSAANDSNPLDGFDEFRRLVSRSGSPEANRAFELRGLEKGYIQVDGFVEKTCSDIGLFVQNGASLEFGGRFEIEFNTGFSALKGIGIYREDSRLFRVANPEKFDAIDESVAGKALQAIRCPSAVAVCYFGTTRHPSHPYRLQAADAYPVLAGHLSEYAELSKTIDQGGKLRDAILETLGLNPGQLKRLARHRAPLEAERIFEFGSIAQGQDALGVNRQRRFTLSGELKIDRTLQIIRNFDTNFLPLDTANWLSLLDIASAAAVPISTLFGTPIEQLLSSSGGNWSRFRGNLAASAGIPAEEFDRQRLALTTIDSIHAIDEFAKTVVLPGLLRKITNSGTPLPVPSARDLTEASSLSYKLLAGSSKNVLGSVFRNGRRWISRIPALMELDDDEAQLRPEKVEKLEPGCDWPRFMDDFETANGLAVVNLVSKRALREESAQLRHCVGRLYLDKAQKGNCHIFSVRSRDGSTSYSTIELAPPAADHEMLARKNPRVIQHKGFRNARPQKKAIASFEEWKTAIKSGNLKLHLENVRNWRTKMNKRTENARAGSDPTSAWAAIIGPNWNDARRGTAVWNEWRNHILSGTLAKAHDINQILEIPDTRRFLARLSPKTADLSTDL